MSIENDMKPWDSKLAKFVQGYGVSKLAKELSVQPSAIYHWIRGATSPHPSKAQALQRLAKLAGVAITLDEIYAHFRGLRSERYRDSDGARDATPTSAPTVRRVPRKLRGAR